jgi:hypothetical protein
MDEEEIAELKALAAQEKMTVSAWVRRAIQHEKRERPGKTARKKLEAVRKLSEYHFPTGNIEQMIAEIEAGYLKDLIP